MRSEPIKNVLLKGHSVSDGYAVGPVVLLPTVPSLLAHYKLEPRVIDAELDRFRNSVSKSSHQLRELIERVENIPEHREIFEAQLLFLKDPMLIEETEKHIRGDRKNAEWALTGVLENIRNHMIQLESDHFRERVSDMEDVGNRILSNLADIYQGDLRIPFLESLPEESILVAEEISPSLMLHIRNIAGIVTEKGGITGHMAILARNRGIPSIVGVTGVLDLVCEGDTLLIDSAANCAVLNPDSVETERVTGISSKPSKILVERLDSFAIGEGELVRLWANLDEVEDFEDARVTGSFGVGLFRTEFIYIRNPKLFEHPEEQMRLYAAVLDAMKGRPVVFRLIDVSDDKQFDLSFYRRRGIEEEEISRLRGIQFLLRERELLSSQLKAIYLAVLETETKPEACRLMLPMISTFEEIQEFNRIHEEVREEIPLSRGSSAAELPTLPVGIMLETPAACLMADVFSEYSNFFSIGTNDLTRFLLAGDRRGSEDYFVQPSVFRMIRQVVQTAAIPISVCGELAAVPELFSVLIGLGIRDFSVSRYSLEKLGRYLREVDLGRCQELAAQVLAAKGCARMREILKIDSLKKNGGFT